MSRINLWTFELPGLKDRPEDLEPNLEYELREYGRLSGKKASFNKEARSSFLAFAASPEAHWRSNFRDLNAAVTRMATLAAGGRITLELVEEEIARLLSLWKRPADAEREQVLASLLGPRARELDLFDLAQLAEVVLFARECPSLSEAGRRLFAASRKQKKSSNDADRLSKYLARFGLSWEDVRRSARP